jgi:hypothetical protein
VLPQRASGLPSYSSDRSAPRPGSVMTVLLTATEKPHRHRSGARFVASPCHPG